MNSKEKSLEIVLNAALDFVLELDRKSEEQSGLAEAYNKPEFEWEYVRYLELAQETTLKAHKIRQAVAELGGL